MDPKRMDSRGNPKCNRPKEGLHGVGEMAEPWMVAGMERRQVE
jgi:hypothetical protein